jgi:hypothetical protein
LNTKNANLPTPVVKSASSLESSNANTLSQASSNTNGDVLQSSNASTPNTSSLVPTSSSPKLNRSTEAHLNFADIALPVLASGDNTPLVVGSLSEPMNGASMEAATGDIGAGKMEQLEGLIVLHLSGMFSLSLFFQAHIWLSFIQFFSSSFHLFIYC